MRIFYADDFVLPLPETHRFPMAKYRLLREAVESSGLVPPEWLRVPEAATDEQLLRVHHPGYVERVVNGTLDSREVRRLGFPWSPELVERSRRSVGGTIGACRSALEHGCGVNLAGGTHHAFVDRGGGFCVFNDIAVAIRDAQADNLIERALVIDCDVHQGDGTAAIFERDPTVFTLSIHGRRNYPLRKERSDLDVELEDGVEDDEYVDALGMALERVARLGRFDLAIFLAGADPYAGDRLGRLALTADGLAARDRLVLGRCRELGLPVAIVMGGGYAPDPAEIAALHFTTVRLAAEIAARTRAPARG